MDFVSLLFMQIFNVPFCENGKRKKINDEIHIMVCRKQKLMMNANNLNFTQKKKSLANTEKNFQNILKNTSTSRYCV